MAAITCKVVGRIKLNDLCKRTEAMFGTQILAINIILLLIYITRDIVFPM